jgi:hypothetical protein
MKRRSSVLTFCLLVNGLLYSQDHKVLTNRDVIGIVALGLSDEVVIEKIRATRETGFDTSAEGLKELKAGKVSDAVIMAMINPQLPVTSEVSYGRKPAELPGFSATDSLAYKRPDGTFEAIKQCSMWTKLAGMNSAVYFGTKVKQYAQLDGLEAMVRVDERKPIFYLRTEGSVGVRPLIVRLRQKTDHREIQTMKMGSLGSWERLPKAERFEVEISQVADGIVSVTPKADLPDGQYVVTLDEMLDQAYDFGVADNKLGK